MEKEIRLGLQAHLQYQGLVWSTTWRVILPPILGAVRTWRLLGLPKAVQIGGNGQVHHFWNYS